MRELGMLATFVQQYVGFDIRRHTGSGVITVYEFEGFLYSMGAGRAFVVGLVEEGYAEVVVV